MGTFVNNVISAALAQAHINAPPDSSSTVPDASGSYGNIVGVASELMDFNVSLLPTVSSEALITALQSTTGMNDALANSFYAAMEAIYPNYQEELVAPVINANQSVQEIISQFTENVAPEINAAANRVGLAVMDAGATMLSTNRAPASAVAAIAQDMDGVATQIRNRGGLTARDLGLQPGALQQLGSQMVAGGGQVALGATQQSMQVAQLAQQSAIETGQFYSRLTPERLDPAAMYSFATQLAYGQNAANPGAALSAGSQAAASSAGAQSDVWGFLTQRSDDIWSGQIQALTSGMT